MAKTNSQKQKDRDAILDPLAVRLGFLTWNRFSTFVKNAEAGGRVAVETSATGSVFLCVSSLHETDEHTEKPAPEAAYDHPHTD